MVGGRGGEEEGEQHQGDDHHCPPVQPEVDIIIYHITKTPQPIASVGKDLTKSGIVKTQLL